MFKAMKVGIWNKLLLPAKKIWSSVWNMLAARK
jgi:hypothetical protein